MRSSSRPRVRPYMQVVQDAHKIFILDTKVLAHTELDHMRFLYTQGFWRASIGETFAVENYHTALIQFILRPQALPDSRSPWPARLPLGRVFGPSSTRSKPSRKTGVHSRFWNEIAWDCGNSLHQLRIFYAFPWMVSNFLITLWMPWRIPSRLTELIDSVSIVMATQETAGSHRRRWSRDTWAFGGVHA